MPRSRNALCARGVLDLSACSFSIDQVLLLLAQGLIDADKSCVDPAKEILFDHRAIDSAREFLLTHDDRVVHSSELESVTGLSRYELSRQFNKLLGTSPYRYSVNRRLDKARRLIGQCSFADLAQQCGFADQAHFSRLFKSTFGITAGKYAQLHTH
ncbi:MAG: helix-turn-helix transcriptional regulator [Oceanospirillaceae bacterium]|nr:helix-turn-helix transcriptional regulator [Oceanospirillaceae bacterium]